MGDSAVARFTGSIRFLIRSWLAPSFMLPPASRAHRPRRLTCASFVRSRGGRTHASLHPVIVPRDKADGKSNHLPQPRKTPASWPDSIATLDRHRKDRHLRLQRQPHRTCLESLQRPVDVLRRLPERSPPRRHHAATATNDESPPDRCLQAPAATRQTTPDIFHDRPTKSSAPREITCRSFDWNRNPKRIDVRLMIGGDDQSAMCRHVLQAVKFNLPEHATKESNDRAGSNSSAHCGNIEPRAGSRSSFLTGNVPLLLKCSVRLILQRPFPIYELDMNSGNAVCAGAARANSRMRGDAILFASQPNEATVRYLQRREESCAFGC